MIPVFFSCFGILSHNPIVDSSPRSTDITLEKSFWGRWYSFQELFFSGKDRLKVWMKVLLVLELVLVLFEKDLDAISAILLFSPWMPTVNRGDDLCTCCLIAMALSSCPAIGDEVLFILFAHDTVAALSQCIPMCACLSDIGVILSSISHANSSPASSRSFMDIVPFGFC